MPSRQSVIRKRYIRDIEKYGTVTCGICDFPIIRASEVTVDHIIPRVLGGRDIVSNFQPAHRVCNERKGHELDFKLTVDTKN